MVAAVVIENRFASLPGARILWMVIVGLKSNQLGARDRFLKRFSSFCSCRTASPVRGSQGRFVRFLLAAAALSQRIASTIRVVRSFIRWRPILPLASRDYAKVLA